MAVLAAVGLLPATVASAKELAPGSLDIAHLGSVSAHTYYTAEEEGFRVVTTLQEDGRDAPVPVRVVTVLQAGQRAVVSVPAGLGEKAGALELVREGDQLMVHHPAE
jgi:hypothetical protein